MPVTIRRLQMLLVMAAITVVVLLGQWLAVSRRSEALHTPRFGSGLPGTENPRARRVPGRRRKVIAFLVPSRSVPGWTIPSIPLLTTFVPSLLQSLDETDRDDFEFAVYFGYDRGDSLYDSEDGGRDLQTLFRKAVGDSYTFSLVTKSFNKTEVRSSGNRGKLLRINNDMDT